MFKEWISSRKTTPKYNDWGVKKDFEAKKRDEERRKMEEQKRVYEQQRKAQQELKARIKSGNIALPTDQELMMSRPQKTPEQIRQEKVRELARVLVEEKKLNWKQKIGEGIGKVADKAYQTFQTTKHPVIKSIREKSLSPMKERFEQFKETDYTPEQKAMKQAILEKAGEADRSRLMFNKDRKIKANEEQKVLQSKYEQSKTPEQLAMEAKKAEFIEMLAIGATEPLGGLGKSSTVLKTLLKGKGDDGAKALKNYLKGSVPVEKLDDVVKGMLGKSVKQAETILSKVKDPLIQEAKPQGRFHGTSSELKKLATDEEMYSPQNIYGQGFYTTDSHPIATGYSKKGAGKAPSIYDIKEKVKVPVYNMEKPMDESLLKQINSSVNDGDPYTKGTTLREVYDDIRELSQAREISSDTAQNYFNTIKSVVSSKGYRGLEHTGGKLTGKEAHNVKIYWNPSEDLTYTKLSQPLQEVKKTPIKVSGADKKVSSLLDYYKQNPRGFDVDALKADYKNNPKIIKTIEKAQEEVKLNAIKQKQVATNETIIARKFNTAKTVGEIREAERMAKQASVKPTEPILSKPSSTKPSLQTGKALTKSTPQDLQPPVRLRKDNVLDSSYRKSSTILDKSQAPQNLSTFRKWFTGGKKILEKSGEGGKKLAGILEKQRTEEDLVRGKYTFRIKNALEGLSKEERINIGEALEGLSKPKSAKEAGAYKTLQNWLAKIARYAEKEGFEISVPTKEGIKKVPFKARENYLPRIYDLDALAKGAKRDRALSHLVESGQARNKAEAVKLLDNFIISNAERKAGNLEYARMLDLPDYEKDPLIALQRYAQSISKRFTEVKNFGKKDETLAELIGKIADDGGDYMEAQRIVDFTTKGMPKNKLVSAITKFNVATKLSLSAIINATQNVNTMTKAGVANTVKAMFKSFTKKGKDFAELSGVYQDLILKQETGFNLDKMTKTILYPFTKVENFNRRVAALSGRESAEALVKKLAIDKDNAFAIRQLQSLGLDAKKILNGKLTDDDLYLAANKMSQLTQFKVDPLDVPPAWKTPTGRLITQFKSFNFMQTKFVRDEILKEVAKGNLAPLVRFIVIAPLASALAYKVRNVLTGRSETDEQKGALDLRDWDKWMKVIGTMPTDILSQGQFLAKTFKSDFLTPLQKGTRAVSTILGPTASEVGNIVAGAEDIQRKRERNDEMRSAIAKGKAKEQDPLLLLKRQAVEKVPFVGQKIKNTVYPFPKSDKSPEEKKMISGYYDWMDEVRKLPSGSKEEKEMIQNKINDLPQEERDRLMGMLRGSGFDIAGIKTSENTIEAWELYNKWKDMGTVERKNAIAQWKKEVGKEKGQPIMENVERYRKNGLAENKGLGEGWMGKSLDEKAQLLIDKTKDMSREERSKFLVSIDKAGLASKDLKKKYNQLK